jgi:hypothetical protein
MYLQTRSTETSTSHREKMMTEDALGMRRHRSRKGNGRLSHTRSDKHVGTIEKQTNRNFGVRSDMHVGTLLKKRGLASVNDLINSKQRPQGTHALLVRSLTYF